MSDGRAALLWLLALGALGPGACRPVSLARPAPAPHFTSETIRIASASDTFEAQVEVASTARQRRYGLSRRTGLNDDAGMLFLFEGEQPRATSFWMFRTRIPLSIAFLDSALVIREILEMRPCRSPLSLLCPSYPSSVRFHAALEMPGGYFARRGLGVADRVLRERPQDEDNEEPRVGSHQELGSGLRGKAAGAASGGVGCWMPHGHRAVTDGLGGAEREQPGTKKAGEGAPSPARPRACRLSLHKSFWTNMTEVSRQSRS